MRNKETSAKTEILHLDLTAQANVSLVVALKQYAIKTIGPHLQHQVEPHTVYSNEIIITLGLLSGTKI